MQEIDRDGNANAISSSMLQEGRGWPVCQLRSVALLRAILLKHTAAEGLFLVLRCRTRIR
jgi:hypothetical protein